MKALQNAFKRSFFARPAIDVAPDLIGAHFAVGGVGGLIVECEAYDAEDPASHSYRNRKTARNKAMFGAAGHAYVYRIYGVHWCVNIVCGAGDGHAVLVRALEPTAGTEQMQTRRHTRDKRLLCSGPGRLCEALAIDRDLDGHDLLEAPFELRPRTAPTPVVAGRRIGITRAAAYKRRFGLRNSPYLSRPF
jgi:DNA-3-methyladenine glycosylase